MRSQLLLQALTLASLASQYAEVDSQPADARCTSPCSRMLGNFRGRRGEKNLKLRSAPYVSERRAPDCQMRGLHLAITPNMHRRKAKKNNKKKPQNKSDGFIDEVHEEATFVLRSSIWPQEPFGAPSSSSAVPAGSSDDEKRSCHKPRKLWKNKLMALIPKKRSPSFSHNMAEWREREWSKSD